MAENRLKEPKGAILVLEASSFHARVSGLVAGGLVFLIVLGAYFSVLFAQRTAVKFGALPLFKIFEVGGRRVYGTRSTMENIYSLYNGPGSSNWADYEYTGRMMLTDDHGGVGVIFLASRRGEKDFLYRLKRCGKGSTLAIGSYPMELNAEGETDTEVSPVGGVWYNFKVQVDDAGARTRIHANVWKGGDKEPAKWQTECFDSVPGRNVKGSVGVWGCSEGEKYFDDLSVRRIAAQPEESPLGRVNRPVPGEDENPNPKILPGSPNDTPSLGYLLREDFSGFRAGTHPSGWKEAVAPLDPSEAADRVSRFFRMNLLDFAGGWDEVFDLGAIGLVFCITGFLAAIILRHRLRLRHPTTSVRKGARIPFELIPFLALFAYAGATEVPVGVVYAGGGACAGYLWRVIYALLLRVLAPSRPARSPP